MKRGIFNKIKGIIGILLIIAVGFGVFYWESYGREALVYEDIVVLKEDIQKNTEITGNLLEYVKRDQGDVIEGALKNPNSIIGKESKHFIPKGTQLVENYFEEASLVLSEEEFIFKIPEDWLKAYPSTLRRKDTAFFYPIDESEKLPEDFNFDNLEINAESITNATVAYVKDSANREVVSTSIEDRLDGTSNIASIEIVATVEKIDLLREYFEDGYKFIILYQ